MKLRTKFAAALGIALLVLAPQSAHASEKVATRIVITQPDGTQVSVELAMEWEDTDRAELKKLDEELDECRRTYRDCHRASSAEVLRSPELYGTYIGMLAGAFAAGYCAVRPEECAKPLER